MRKISLLLPCLFLGLGLFAQTSKDVLLTINDKPVYADEFSRVFSKNLSLVQEEEDRDVEEYLDLFIDYKLKVMEAEALKLDTLPTFTGEYNIYKKQLARKFIGQSEVSENLMKEAYDRMQEEVNASHILLMLSPEASPQDTLKVYKKTMEIRKEILNSDKTFADFAKEYSEDPSAKTNGGDLGWFCVFNMVYPFESGAYNTKVGQISMPVRSSYGFHLIKLNDKRSNEGEVTVAHIMLENGKDEAAAEAQINKLYQQLQNGASFEDLAKQYSEDKNTAVNGGKLNTFKRGKLNSEKFETAAFSLIEPGQITKPVNTKYGWHIIKLLEKNVVGSYDKEKFMIEKSIKKDSRAQLIASEVLENIKKIYSIQEDDPKLDFFKKNIKINITQEPWKSTELKNIPQKNLISINEEGETYQEFADYIAKRQKTPSNFNNTNDALEAWYEDYKDSYLNEYHRDHLAEVDEEYAHVVEEYRNGLLLFDLMEKKVWNAARKDSMALKKHYDQHREEYKTPTIYNGIIASSSDKSEMKKVRKALKKEKAEKVIVDYKDVIFNNGEFTMKDTSLPEDFNGKEGVSKLYEHNGLFVVVKVGEVKNSMIKPFEDARGQVISDYQKEMEKKWIAGLREKHTIKVNEGVLAKLEQKFE